MAETANVFGLDFSFSLKETILISACSILVLLWAKYLSSRQFDLALDVAVSIVIIVMFYIFYSRLGQDNLSFLGIAFAAILHNLNLYSTAPFGVNFDHYMHFAGSFAVALAADRFLNEKSRIKRLFLVFIIALGIGSIGEILEWTGYALFGDGNGFFLYGMGDEGGYTNVNLDMIFNGLGGFAMGLISFFRKK